MSIPTGPIYALRTHHPMRFEAGSDIARDSWTRLRLSFSAEAFADGQLILQGNSPWAAAHLGSDCARPR